MSPDHWIHDNWSFWGRVQVDKTCAFPHMPATRNHSEGTWYLPWFLLPGVFLLPWLLKGWNQPAPLGQAWLTKAGFSLITTVRRLLISSQKSWSHFLEKGGWGALQWPLSKPKSGLTTLPVLPLFLSPDLKCFLLEMLPFWKQMFCSSWLQGTNMR